MVVRCNGRGRGTSPVGRGLFGGELDGGDLVESSMVERGL